MARLARAALLMRRFFTSATGTCQYFAHNFSRCAHSPAHLCSVLWIWQRLEEIEAASDFFLQSRDHLRKQLSGLSHSRLLFAPTKADAHTTARLDFLKSHGEQDPGWQW